MKKIIALIISLAAIFSLVSCGSKYEPVKSTAEESRVVMTATVEGKTYNIKYELYRALFLSAKASVDGGDESVWSGENKEQYIAAIEEIIKSRVSDIYSVLHVADKIGIDIYSDEFDDYVEDFISISVTGGYFEDTEIIGFEGDYQAYLEHLKEQNLNYSVQDLLIRYSLASAKIFAYYAGTMDSEEFVDNAVMGKLQYTEQDVLDFYNSSDCVRVIRANLSSNIFTKERAEEIRLGIIEKAKQGEDSVANYIIQFSTAGGSSVKAGEVIAKHNLDREYYKELTDAAFNMDTFAVSDVIEVLTDTGSGYVIIYKTIKASSMFENNYNVVRAAYVENEVGKIIDTAWELFEESLNTVYTSDMISHADIKMD